MNHNTQTKLTDLATIIHQAMKFAFSRGIHKEGIGGQDGVNTWINEFVDRKAFDSVVLLEENEQLKEQVGDLTKSVKYFSDLYHDEDKDHKSNKALNAELLDALKYLRDNTTKIDPEHWQTRTADALTFAEKILAKAEPK